MKDIKRAVDRLIKRHETRDPFEIARFEGYTVMYKDWDKIKGYYFKALKKRFIIINQNMDELSKHIICAHELGHGEMHDIALLHFLRENTLFPTHSIAEKEANLFAAELILSDTFEMDVYYDDDKPLNVEIFNKLVEIKRQNQ